MGLGCMAPPASTSPAALLLVTCMVAGAAAQVGFDFGGAGPDIAIPAELDGPVGFNQEASAASSGGGGQASSNATASVGSSNATASVGAEVSSNETASAGASGQGSSNATGSISIGSTDVDAVDNAVPSGDGVFNVVAYGAVADGTTENSKAFLDAWKATCAYQGSSTFLVPQGTFLLGPVVLQGPCSNNHGTQIIIKGTIRALPSFSTSAIVGWIEISDVFDLTVKGRGTLDGQGAQSWGLNTCRNQLKCKTLPTSLRFVGVINGVVTDLNLINSKGFHINFHKCANIETRFLNITAPEHSPNTDGIHISGTTAINVTHMTIATGDDCISIGPGATDVKIANITCGPGHGISIGSLGKYTNEADVFGVKVRNCTLTGTKNGLRIKTWPAAPASKAMNVTFEDIILNNVANPIIIDQQYCPVKNCKPEPSMVKLQGIAFRRISGTSTSAVAVHMVCSQAAPCEDVVLEDVQVQFLGGEPTAICAFVRALFLGSQKPNPCVL